MAYGHAERNLALVRQLEAETRRLLESLDRLDPEQSAWLQEVTRPHRPVPPAPDGPMISIEGTVVALGDLIGKDKIGHIRLCEASPRAIRQGHTRCTGSPRRSRSTLSPPVFGSRRPAGHPRAGIRLHAIPTRAAGS